MTALRMRRFLVNYSVINIAIVLCVALCFILLIPMPLTASIAANHSPLSSYSFLVLGLLGQFGIIGLCATAFITVLLLVLRTLFRTGYYDFFGVLFAAVFMTLLVLLIAVDFAVYRLIGDHLTETFWNVLFSGAFFQVIVLSNAEWIALWVGFCLVLSLEVVLATWLWRSVSIMLSRTAWCLAGCIVLAAGSSYAFYFMNTDPGRELPQLAKLIPYFSQISNRFSAATPAPQQLNYPRQPLVFKPHPPRLNILIMVIDTWRSDMLDPDVTPYIADFAQQSLRFSNHFSGGNYTRPGIFSLLYSLSPQYWSQIERRAQGPLLIHQLLQDGYAIKILPSASPRFPDFIHTAFRDVPAAWRDTPGANATQRDLHITDEFKQFLATRDPNQPFFGFLFYDAVHSWCGGTQTYATPFQPAITVCNRLGVSSTTNPLLYLNRYRNAVHYDDALIGTILDQLTQRNLLKNTIVIITADHGEEFNDSGRGIWGHGSAFDKYQLQVPFIMHWPGQTPEVIAYRTSHYDVVPTLMSDVLGCENPASDYSIGRSLFAVDRPPYIVVNSASTYAKLFAHSFKIYYPGGFSVVTDLSGHS